MMHEFRTRHSEFEGFSAFFDAEVRPTLAGRESARKKAVKRSILWSGVISSILVACGIWLIRAYPDDNIFGVLAMIAALAAPFIIFYVATEEIREETKLNIVSSIVGYVGWSFEPEVPEFDMGRFRELFLLPRHIDREKYEDRLWGEAHGAAFSSVEAHLERQTTDSKGRRKWQTVFRGQLMTLDFPTKTFGRTIVLRDKGWFNPKKKSDMKRIGLVDPTFEKLFEAYGTDQVESRVILDPAFMQRMVDLEAAVSGKKIRFGFEDDRLFIAVETRDQYEAGSMFTSLTDPTRTQKILDEVSAIYDIADLLLGRKKEPKLPY